MPFLIYPSIKNHNTISRGLNSFLEKNLIKIDDKFIVQHKYDGSNFQIIFEKKDSISIKFASRNHVLEENSDFNQHKTLVKFEPYVGMIENIKQFFIEQTELTSINLYGEIYGNVITRVTYYAPNESRQKNKLIFFDVKFNNKP